MVFDVEPIADLLAVAVHRQRFARQRVGDHQRDQLLGEVVRAVVVGAVAGRDRQAVGVVPGAHEVIRGGLAGRVRAVRFVGIGFGEGRVGGLQGAVDLVGAHVVEAKDSPGLALQRRPVAARGFQQGEGAVDIGAHELAGAVDAAIHVRFGGEMHDRARLVGRQQRIDQRPVADVARHKGVTCVALQALEVLQIARVGQLVQRHHRLVALLEPVQHEIAANEAGPAGHQNRHATLLKMKGGLSIIPGASVTRPAARRGKMTSHGPFKPLSNNSAGKGKNSKKAHDDEVGD